MTTSSTAAHRVPAPGDVVTMLVHHAPSAVPPAHRAVLYQTASVRTTADELGSYETVVAHAARLGADTVLLGGVLPDPRDPRTAAAARPVLRRAARLGLKVVASIRPATGWDMGASDLIDRAEGWLSLGADGVDVGALRPASPELAAARALAQHLATREDALWCASAASSDEVDIAKALSDGPPPLLRHDRLWQAGWDPHALRDHITRSARGHDTARGPLVWSIFSGAPISAPRRSTAGVDAAGAHRRFGAATSAMLALPGVMMIRQGEEVSLPFAHEDDSPGELAAQVSAACEEQRGVPGSPYETYRNALRLRADLGLGAGSLSWVQHDALPPAATFAYLTRDVLVVMVVGEEPVRLPTRRPVLHSSAPVPEPVENGVQEVPADTTVWLSLAGV